MAVTEGQQVMALITKRLRAHRKKYNRITAMEESMSQGITLNKEQKETIRSKPIVTALIEELEKLLIPPTSTVVSEEISLPPKKTKPKLNSLQAPKEIAEEGKVTGQDATEKDETGKTEIEDCKISDGLDAGEVSKDNSSPCSVSSQGVTPPSAGNGKPRRKRKSKKPQTSN